MQKQKKHKTISKR